MAWFIIWVMGLAGAASVLPDPPPPHGFSAAQYIDASGCVFQRKDAHWVIRTDRQGVPVCGFPPTLSQRGLTLAEPEAVPTIEEKLLEQLAGGLRDGEFTADPRPAEIRLPGPVATGDTPLERDLAARIAGQQGIFAAMSDHRRSGDLCRLLGYEPATDPVPVLGGDVTYGLCPGMIAQIPGPQITEGVRPATVASIETAEEAAVISASENAMMTPTAETSAQVADAAVAPPRHPDVSTAASHRKTDRQNPDHKTTVRKVPLSSAQVEMIPATARYIQIGAYADEGSAQQAARKLINLGYAPGLMRHKGYTPSVRLLLVGPFAERGALIRALNDLRNRGYAQAVAR